MSETYAEFQSRRERWPVCARDLSDLLLVFLADYGDLIAPQGLADLSRSVGHLAVMGAR